MFKPSFMPIVAECKDKSVRLAGQTCYDWLRNNLAACDHPTITTSCCGSRARLCNGAGGSLPKSPGGSQTVINRPGNLLVLYFAINSATKTF